jgi:hypothetical protein
MKHAMPSPVHPDPDDVMRQIARRSLCVLGTASATNEPHSACVLYAPVGSTLYVNTLRTSKKARNLAVNPHVSVCIPIRRVPVGPPSSVQFRATAEILPLSDAEIGSLVRAGALKTITGHGELDEPNGCFLRIVPTGRIATYGLGLSLRRLIRDPLHAGGAFELTPEVQR